MTHPLARLTLALLLAGTGLAPLQAQTSAAPAAAAAAASDEVAFTVTGFEVVGDNPLGEARTQSTLKPFTGEHTGIERLQQAASALEAVLREEGFGFHRVVLPPQDIGGVIKLQMFKFRIGQVEIKGNQFYTNDNVLRSLPELKPGQTPNTYELARDLAVANENPSKRANVTFKQGTVPDTIDANVEVKDSRTVSGFASLANTGSSTTGYGRLTLGASHHNLFDRDHQVTATYTTSTSDPGAVHQYGAYYRAPMYEWGGVLSGYYTWSSVNAGNIAGLNVTGRGKFLGLQYSHYFSPRGDYRDHLTIGIEDKLFDNSKILTGGGLPVFPDYRTRPVTVSYVGRFEKGWGYWGFNVDVSRNLTWGGGNNDIVYSANRAGASNRWLVVRGGADAVVSLPADWVGSVRARMQMAGKPLVPGEQFGIGGAQSVRGLTERQLSGDTGWQLSLEALSPPLMENLRGLVFFDVGQARRHDDQLTPMVGASSVGVGLRWNLGSTASASVDYAKLQTFVNGFVPGQSRERVHLALGWKF